MAVETKGYVYHLYEKNGPVAKVTFNRPEKRNAHNSDFFRELYDALDDADNDPEIRVVVIASTGPVFCAGQDLKFTATADKAARLEYGMLNRRARDKIQYMPKPVIARVQGPSLGGGMYIATASDLIVALKTARFQMREIRAGDQSGGSHLLTVGKQRALELNLLSRSLNGEEAERWGLINKCVETEEEMDAVIEEWIKELASFPPLGIAATKRASNLALDLAGYSALRQAEVGRELIYTEDYREAKRAFAEKRAPEFHGR